MTSLVAMTTFSGIYTILGNEMVKIYSELTEEQLF
jgi:hypothetical protein